VLQYTRELTFVPRPSRCSSNPPQSICSSDRTGRALRGVRTRPRTRERLQFHPIDSWARGALHVFFTDPDHWRWRCDIEGRSGKDEKGWCGRSRLCNVLWKRGRSGIRNPVFLESANDQVFLTDSSIRNDIDSFHRGESESRGTNAVVIDLLAHPAGRSIRLRKYCVAASETKRNEKGVAYEAHERLGRDIEGDGSKTETGGSNFRSA
jgi:hypothetical protein